MPPDDNLCKECQLKADLKTGVGLAKAGDYDKALELLKHICSADGLEEDRAAAHYYTGVIFSKQDKMGLAESEWWKCLDLEPGYNKAKKKLVEVILQRPKRQWEKHERVLVEGTDFSKATPRQQRARGGSNTATRCVIALCVLVVVGGGGFLGFHRAIDYFTFDRHIENIQNLVRTGQTARSLQYFNDNFRLSGGTERRQEAEKVLAPIYMQAALERLKEGDPEQARQLLRIAAGFDPEDEDIKKALGRLQPASVGTEPAGAQPTPQPTAQPSPESS